MPKKLALLIHSLKGGGAERLMSQLANRWCAEHEVHLLTWAKESEDAYPLDSRVKRIGLDLQFPSRGVLGGILANWRRVSRLRGQLIRIQPELVLSFSDQMNILALEATRPLPVPTWISEHSDPAKQRLSPLWELWRQRSYPRCAGCVALTQGIADYMQRWIPADKLRVIPPAIEPIVREWGQGEVREQSMAVPKKVLFVGRLSREKGVDLLLDAWIRIGTQVPDWELTIVGDGPERQSLQQRASALPNVQFVGWLESPWPAYQSAQIFVLPSLYEGFPVALLEAMSMGLSCISTNCSTAITQLQRSADGLLVVPVRDVEALGEAILRLAQDGELRGQLGHAAERIARQYHWERIGPAWDAVLQEGGAAKGLDGPDSRGN